MRISDWSSDVCSSDRPAKIHLLSLEKPPCQCLPGTASELQFKPRDQRFHHAIHDIGRRRSNALIHAHDDLQRLCSHHRERSRSEEHTSELQSLMRIQYAVLCLKKKKHKCQKKKT